MTKCSHDKCINEVESGSPYCKDCIHLPTKECNFCNIGDAEPSEDQKLSQAIEKQMSTPTPVWLAIVMVYFFVLGGIAIGVIIAKILEIMGFGWWFIEGGVIGGIVGLGAGIREMVKRGWL